MQTSQIKRFATEARIKLKDGIAAKILQMGFDRKGNVAESMMPQLFQGGAVWRGQTVPEGFYNQWMSLYHRIKAKGITEVYEEAAYTWFNRLVAIRILQKNGLAAPVLDFADETLTPRIVNEARMGRLPQMPEAQRQMLVELLDDDTKVTEQFAMLITAWCHQNPIIQSCFGGIADYTELLLPNNILAEGGFVYMLNHTDFITDEDWRTSELIGWLYQFYISERKDEVFAKKGKFEADEIPAATQIFTPNWIVKYMVQNTILKVLGVKYEVLGGKDNFLSRYQYYIPEDEVLGVKDYGLGVNTSTLTPNTLDITLEQIRVADLACGSGHILNECFDLLFDLYTFEGYSRREAIENIFTKNLTGIDLDTRAQQLSKFALLLKACQKDEAFADAHCMPHVLTMPVTPPCGGGDGREAIHHFFLGNESQQTTDELAAAYELMKDADSLGSIMRFPLADSTRLALQQMVSYWDSQSIVPAAVAEQMPAMRLILALTDRYHALVMNPPYMGSGNMNATLSAYVKRNYEKGKADLFSVFMLLAEDRLTHGGRYGMINMQSWMFLSSFEALRRHVLEETVIESMLHLGPRTFDELSGEVVQNSAFVIRKSEQTDATSGTYYRLVDGKNCGDKERMFLEAKANLNPNTSNIIHKEVPQDNFNKIPGSPIGYWVSEKILKAFEESLLNNLAIFKRGIGTGDNNRFLRLWFEVNLNKTDLNKSGETKWVKYNKGGSYRKWFGNREYLVDWENDGEAIKNNVNSEGKLASRPQNLQYNFKKNISYSSLTSGSLSFRSFEGFINDQAGNYFIVNDDDNYIELLAILNSKIAEYFKNLKNSTLNITAEDLLSIPCVINHSEEISSLVEENISISREDWDAHETSWDFGVNGLVAMDEERGDEVMREFFEQNDLEAMQYESHPESLQWRMEMLKRHWNTRLLRLRQNEEELNRRFIAIYGLEDELTPDVPLSEVTILQAGEISISNDIINWNDNVLTKQLISYAVGVWMGRYRLDRPGLHIAHPDPTDEELAPYLIPNTSNLTLEIDDDGIIPLMAQDCGFADNAARRMAEFVRQVFGEDSQAQNLNYMEQCLGKTIEQYFIKDFWKDHKRMYQNRPIYWLFASKKGAFQVLVYMHRMNAYTAERIRSKYLLPYIETLRNRMNDMASRAADLSTQERKRLELTIKQLEECTEYHDRLAVVAEQAIALDLDDGVVVNHAKFGDVVVKIK